MRNAPFGSIRWKFIAMFLGSIALASAFALCTYMIFYFSVYAPIYDMSPGNRPEWAIGLFWIINEIGSTPFLVTLGVAVFLVFFFLLSNRMVRHVEEITAGIQEVAKGDFSHRIAVRSRDELGIVADTVNRMTEQLKRSIEEERQAEQTKNDLITGVSHDLRTPLTSIIGFLEYVENDRYRDEVELRHYVSIAYEKSLGLKKLIDDLFEYTRTSARGLPLQFGPVNITDVLQQLAEEFVPQLRSEGMHYRLSSASPDVLIYADVDELVRAYENLLSNAVRYGKAGKEVQIEIAKEEEEVSVKIINYGEAIPRKDLPYLFERFYRVDKSRSKDTGGTGLGLAITKNIVELHGGRIFARSSLKETTFETRFPLLSDAKEAQGA